MARQPRKSGGTTPPADELDAMLRRLQARILDSAPVAPPARWGRVNHFLKELQDQPHDVSTVRSAFLIPLA